MQLYHKLSMAQTDDTAEAAVEGVEQMQRAAEKGRLEELVKEHPGCGETIRAFAPDGGRD